MNIVLIFLLVVASALAQCHNKCSRHGSCNTEGCCDCHDGFRGSDCSERICPSGQGFSDPAPALDEAHQNVECSGRGLCDWNTGDCKCMEGFTGIACERTMCSSDCNGNGKCMSYRDFGINAFNSMSEQYDYTSIWDADKIYGCFCDYGYSGYDCSLQMCVTGDDPMTPGGDQEVQLLRCSADSGHFILQLNGFYSNKIPVSASEVDIENALSSIKGVGRTSVTFSEGSIACRSDVANIVLITFLEFFGPVPPLVYSGINMNFGAFVTIGADPSGAMIDENLVTHTPVKGSKENYKCSNRGLCNYNTGVCECFADNGGQYAGSDGYGGSGSRGDCGFPLTTINSCPNDCSGNGICDPTTKTCSCVKGYEGGDCSRRTCPMGKSWFSYPSGDNVGHDEWAVCSNMGKCSSTTGECICHTGYFGSTCEYLGCGPNITTPCNGHGICLSMSNLAQYYVDSDGNPSPQKYGTIPNDPATWDADRIFGCHCDESYEGYDCSLRSCLYGDDPNTAESIQELCSNHGICDRHTGECDCLDGWGNSDGAGNVGTIGDCGYRLPISVLPKKGNRVKKKYVYKPA